MAIDWNGHPKIPADSVRHRRMRTVAEYVLRRHGRAVITSTHDGTHAPTSLHGQWPGAKPRDWRALDFGAKRPPDTAMKRRVQKDIFDHFPHRWFAELYGPVNDLCLEDGRRVTLGEGSVLETQHDTHVHVGFA